MAQLLWGCKLTVLLEVLESWRPLNQFITFENVLTHKQKALNRSKPSANALCHISPFCNRRSWTTAICASWSPHGFTPSMNDKRCCPINPTLLSHELYSLHTSLYVVKDKPQDKLQMCPRFLSLLWQKYWAVCQSWQWLYTVFYEQICCYLEQIFSSFDLVWGKNTAKMSVGVWFKVTSSPFFDHFLFHQCRSCRLVPS